MRSNVSGALQHLQDGLRRRQDIAAVRALLEVMQDTAHVMAKVSILGLLFCRTALGPSIPPALRGRCCRDVGETSASEGAADTWVARASSRQRQQPAGISQRHLQTFDQQNCGPICAADHVSLHWHLQVEKLLSEISSMENGGKQQRPDSASASPLESRARILERLASEVARLNFYTARGKASSQLTALTLQSNPFLFSVCSPQRPYVPMSYRLAHTFKRSTFYIKGEKVTLQISAQR